MNILIDIGNTRLKWCVDENGFLNTADPITYKQNNYIKQLQKKWVTLAAPDLLAISSVSSTKIVFHIKQLAKQLWPTIKVKIAESSAHGFSVCNAYQQPETLGVDRWLGLIALRHYYPGNSCLVDCGTAITIDCLNHQGKHLGGVICPGIQLMRHSLFQGTEDLSVDTDSYPLGLADFTESAIFTGTLFAAAGLIEKTIKQLCHCQIHVFSGGDAALLANYVDIEAVLDYDIVLKGLSLFCREENG